MTSLVAVYCTVCADEFGGSQVRIATVKRYRLPLFYCAHIVYCSKVCAVKKCPTANTCDSCWNFNICQTSTAKKCIFLNNRDTCRNFYIRQTYAFPKRIPINMSDTFWNFYICQTCTFKKRKFWNTFKSSCSA